MKRLSLYSVLVVLLCCLCAWPSMAQMGRGPGAVSGIGQTTTQPLTQCTTIKAASATDDYDGLLRFAYSATLRAWHCIQAGATNVVGSVYNCDGNATNCNAVSVDLTCTTTESDNSTLNAYSSVASGHYVGWRTTSVSGTNTWVTVCVDYTID